eukprot:scaffold54436_cov39-Attheya_sp.AAC.1
MGIAMLHQQLSQHRSMVAQCHIVAIFYYASTASIVKPCSILLLAFGTDYVTPMKSARHVYS